jgi:hypothetical protein
VREHVRVEGVEHQGHQPRPRPGQVAREPEHDQPEQQGQHDDREAGGQEDPERVVATLVQQVPSQQRLVLVEGRIQYRMRERQPGRHRQLGQRRVLRVVTQAVLLLVDHRGADVHRLVDRRRLLHRLGDHGERHPTEQRSHNQEIAQASRHRANLVRFPEIFTGRGPTLRRAGRYCAVVVDASERFVPSAE